MGHQDSARISPTLTQSLKGFLWGAVLPWLTHRGCLGQGNKQFRSNGEQVIGQKTDLNEGLSHDHSPLLLGGYGPCRHRLQGRPLYIISTPKSPQGLYPFSKLLLNKET